MIDRERIEGMRQALYVLLEDAEAGTSDEADVYAFLDDVSRFAATAERLRRERDRLASDLTARIGRIDSTIDHRAQLVIRALREHHEVDPDVAAALAAHDREAAR